MPDVPSLRPRGPQAKTSLHLQRVRLDITDLRAIETELHGIGDLEVTSDQFEGKAKSIDEFVLTGVKTLSHVVFGASSYGAADPQPKYLTVTLEPTDAYVRGSDDRIIAGVFVNIELLLRSRQRRLVQWCASNLPIAGILVGMPFVLATGLLATHIPLSSVLLVYLIAVICLAIAGVVIDRMCPGAILLESRDAVPGWFKRNRDGLSVQVIGGAVVLFIGIGIGLWIK